jgi:2-polyprenyl-3-methyl-5-hydroxy-6-metoxy-1,4-benzoquinol methylase
MLYIYKLLIDKLGIQKKNIELFSEKTRDILNAKVYRDKVSNVIFLKKNYLKKNHYENGNPRTGKFALKDDLRRYNQFKKIIKNKIILDVGCGDGTFLSLIKNSKFVSGIEINKYLQKKIKKNKKKIEIFNNLSSVNKKFDVITIFHVLEHIEDPISFLTLIKSKMKKNSTLIIEVPSCNDLLFSCNIDAIKKFVLWSEHLVLFNNDTLKKILKLVGFKKIKIENYQRYHINNHLHWMIYKKPAGHIKFPFIKDKKIINSYNKLLISKGLSDTLIAKCKI